MTKVCGGVGGPDRALGAATSGVESEDLDTMANDPLGGGLDDSQSSIDEVHDEVFDEAAAVEVVSSRQ